MGLAQRIDGRIGDLGEELIEVVEERARFAREAGKGRVDAHGGKRRFTGGRHGPQDFVHVIPVYAQLGGAHRARNAPILCAGSLLGISVALLLHKGVQGDGLFVNPITERLELCHLVAQLVVVAHAASLHVDLEHFARPQTAAGQHVGGIDFDGAHFGGEQEAVVAGDVVARGAQAVAVQGGAQGAAVREGDRGGAVPGFHQHGLVGVVGAAFG